MGAGGRRGRGGLPAAHLCRAVLCPVPSRAVPSRAVPRSLPRLRLHPRWLLAVPEVRRPPGEGSLAGAAGPAFTSPSPESGVPPGLAAGAPDPWVPPGSPAGRPSPRRAQLLSPPVRTPRVSQPWRWWHGASRWWRWVTTQLPKVGAVPLWPGRPWLARCPPDTALCPGHMDAMVLQVRRSLAFLAKQYPGIRWAAHGSVSPSPAPAAPSGSEPTSLPGWFGARRWLQQQWDGVNEP